MARHVFVIVGDALPPEKAKLYEDWYLNTHMADILAMPGMVSGQRFLLQPNANDPETQPGHLVIYEVETDDLEGYVAEINRRWGTALMPQFEGESPNFKEYIGAALTPRISAPVNNR